MPHASVAGVEDALDVDVQLVALRQHLIELVLTKHGTQRRLRQLAGGLEWIRNLDDRLVGFDDTEINDCVHLDRDVVTRDHVLGRHVEHDHAQVDLDHALHEWHEQDQARALHAREAAEREDHAALIFIQDLEDLRGNDDQQHHADGQCR